MSAGRRDISAIMRKVRSRDTTPEMVFRKALWARGLRYRTCRAPLAGKPDIVLAGSRLALFIDGDFWHGGQWRKRRLSALEDQFTNTPTRDYWLGKIRRNMQRDCLATSSLMQAGWRIIRFWESQVYRQLDECVDLALRAARAEIAPDPLSALPAKRFVRLCGDDGSFADDLAGEGWSPAGEGAELVSLAIASFETAPPPGFWSILEKTPKLAPLLWLMSGRSMQAAPQMRALGYTVTSFVGDGSLIGHPEYGEPVGLPDCPPGAEPIQWIARYFLNPMVGELMRGRVLGALSPLMPEKANGRNGRGHWSFGEGV